MYALHYDIQQHFPRKEKPPIFPVMLLVYCTAWCIRDGWLQCLFFTSLSSDFKFFKVGLLSSEDLYSQARLTWMLFFYSWVATRNKWRADFLESWKVWNGYETLFSVYNEILHHLRYYHGADDATQLHVLRNNTVGFVESFIYLFLNDFRSTSCCRIWIAEEGMCSKAKALWEAVIILGGTEGPRFVLQPLRGNAPSLKTLQSNRRIILMGQKCCFIQKKEISEPLSARPNSELLTVPFSVHYQCVTMCVHTCVCLCQHLGGILSSHYTLHS